MMIKSYFHTANQCNIDTVRLDVDKLNGLVQKQSLWNMMALYEHFCGSKDCQVRVSGNYGFN